MSTLPALHPPRPLPQFCSLAACLPASPTQVALPPVSSSSHPGKEVLIGQHEQKEPFPGSPGRRESEAGFEEPAKGGEALALKMLLQFGTWQSRGTARGGARRWGAREKAPAGTLHSFISSGPRVTPRRSWLSRLLPTRLPDC